MSVTVPSYQETKQAIKAAKLYLQHGEHLPKKMRVCSICEINELG